MRDILAKKGLVLGIILLFTGVSVVPSISSNNNASELSDSEILEGETLDEDCYCTITRPEKGLYISDDLYWIFRIIGRPVIFGLITFEAKVFNPPGEIECVNFSLYRIWSREPFITYSDYNEPWEWTYTDWSRRGLLRITAKTYPENDCVSDELQYWDLG